MNNRLKSFASFDVDAPPIAERDAEICVGPEARRRARQLDVHREPCAGIGVRSPAQQRRVDVCAVVGGTQHDDVA